MAGYGVTLFGTLDMTYTIETSIDLTTWTPLSTHFVDEDGSVPLILPFDPDALRAFLRAVNHLPD